MKSSLRVCTTKAATALPAQLPNSVSDLARTAVRVVNAHLNEISLRVGKSGALAFTRFLVLKELHPQSTNQPERYFPMRVGCSLELMEKESSGPIQLVKSVPDVLRPSHVAARMEFMRFHWLYRIPGAQSRGGWGVKFVATIRHAKRLFFRAKRRARQQSKGVRLPVQSRHLRECQTTPHVSTPPKKQLEPSVLWVSQDPRVRTAGTPTQGSP